MAVANSIELNENVLNKAASIYSNSPVFNTKNTEQILLDILESINNHNLPNDQRYDCMIYLRECLYYFSLEKNDINTSLIATLEKIAYSLCDWPFLISLYKKIPENIFKGFEIQSTFQLADFYFFLGAFNQSSQVIKNKLIADPDNEQLNQYWNRLQQYSYHSSIEHLLVDETIALTPLEPHHMHDFSWQYSRAIIELCNLPNFTSEDDWQYWLEIMHSESNRALFAIVHQEWGFIGSVSLQVFRGVGFFYYWLGEDFQGQGYGPRAVERLLQYGYYHMGMHCCYAKVYDYNTPSHQAIRKLGFSRLPISALEPDQNEVFYYRGQKKADAEYFQELNTLLNDMDSGIQITPSLTNW